MSIKHNIFLVLFFISLAYIPTNSIAQEENKSVNILSTRVIDIEGEIHRIGIDNGTSYPVVLVFVDAECPISKRYIPRLNKLAIEAESKNVKFYGVISDPLTLNADALSFKEAYKINFPLLYDASGDIAKKLNPTIMPQAFVLDVHNRIIYNGRIDDEYVAVGKVQKKFLNHNLQLAIEAAASKAFPESQYEQPIGCIFESWKTEYPEEITYTKDIAPIINANCVTCHRKGEIGPYSLFGYENLKRRARMVNFVTKEHYMPIWKPTKNFGEFRDEHFLSDYQIELINKWVKDDMPQGDEKHKSAEPVFENLDWKHGKPDKVLTMPEKYTVAADGEDIYRYFVLSENEFNEEKIIKALDFKPGANTVVHHCIFLLDYSGKAKELDKKDPEPGFSVFNQDGLMQQTGVFAFGGWTPGTDPYVMGDNIGMKIPAGAVVVLEIHYHLTGKEEVDQSSLAIYYDQTKPEKFISGMIMGTKDITIPANEAGYEKRIWMEAPAGFSITDITPHLHYIGHSVSVTATFPNGVVVPLIQIDDWDLRWQNISVYREPIHIPKGSIVEATYVYNNTSKNSNNPNNPPKEVGWGWGAEDEMCELFMTFIPDNPEEAGLIKRAALTSWVHIDTLSQKYLISKRGVEQTATDLLTVDIWSEKGQTLLLSVYETNHIKEVLSYFKKAEPKNIDNVRFLTNYSVVVMLFISTKESMSGVFWDAYKVNTLLKNALQRDADNWDALYTKGYSLVETQKIYYIKQGLRKLEKLIKKYPSGEEFKYHHVYISLAKAYNANGQREQAKKTIEKGLSLFPESKRLQQEYVTYK